MRLALWTLRDRFPVLTPRVAPSWIVLLFVVVEFWTTIDWGAVAQRLAALGPARGLVGAALVAASARTAGPLYLPAPFRRILPRRAEGPLLLPTAAYAAFPALCAAALFPGGPLLRAVGWLAALLWADGPFLLALPVVFVLGEALGDAFAPARLLLDVPLLLAAGWRVPRDAPTGPGGWRPRTRFGAVLGRDLVCLWREERRLVLTALALAPFPATLVWGLRVNGRADRSTLATAIALLLCLVSPGAASALGSLRSRLGTRFAPRSWPVPGRIRVASLVTVFLLWLLPSHAAMAATGGVVPALVPLPLVGMLAAGAAWLSTFARLDLGFYGMWTLAAVGLALAGAPLAGALAAVPPLWHAARRLSWR